MDALNFCYWLQGFVETRDSDPPNKLQWDTIVDHLNLVFDKQTPDRKAKPGVLDELLKRAGVPRPPAVPEPPPIYPIPKWQEGDPWPRDPGYPYDPLGPRFIC